MKLPVRLSIIVLILNTIFSIIFMNIWGVYGLAFANLLSAILHTIFAVQAMKESYMISFRKGLKDLFLPILIGLSMIAVICLLGKVGLSYFDFTHKIYAFVSVSLLIPMSVGCYFYVLKIFKISDLSFVKSLKSNHEISD
jgi:peptidoglycan biosynthesis protein MviN/MurJ (putative lipid II flippase)